MSKGISVYKLIDSEINDFTMKGIETSPGVNFNQYENFKILQLFDRKIYETGNRDSQNGYKWWIDIITPRLEDEVKAIDININNLLLWSPAVPDATAVFLLQNALRNELDDTGEGVDLNDDLEEFSGYGNILWKKSPNGRTKADWRNTYLSNAGAKYINETAVIERHELTQSELEAKRGIWNDEAIDFIIANNKEYSKKTMKDGAPQSSEVPYYELIERNGEISHNMLMKLQGKDTYSSDKNKSVIAHIVIPASKLKSSDSGMEAVLQAKEIDSMDELYIEAHRGRYKGTWWRDGMISTLLDLQVSANETFYQISKALEWAAKVILQSEDTNNLPQNIMTDLLNGDVIKTKGLKQVDVRLHNLDQLVLKWNLIMAEADRLSKSTEISRGEAQPAGTPAKLGNLLDNRSSEYHNYIRQKFSLGYRDVIKKWQLKDIIKKIKREDAVRITGNIAYLEAYDTMVISAWEIKNVGILGQYTAQNRQVIKELMITKMKDRKDRKTKIGESGKDVFTGVYKRLFVVITGENVDLRKELQNNYSLIQLELDPVRRQALIEQTYSLLGKDITNMPKTPPAEMAMIAAPAGPGGNPNQKQLDTE